MKKLLVIIFAIFCISSSAQAQTLKTIRVEAMEDFSTAAPAPTFRVRIIEPDYLPDGTVLQQGAIVSGFVYKVTNARRLKKDGYFEFVPNKISVGKYCKNIKNPQYIARVADYEPLDPKQLVGSAAKTAAGYFVKGATQGISFAQGFVQAQNGERLKSGVTKVFNDSPLSYIEEGSELEVKPGDTLVLIIKDINDN